MVHGHRPQEALLAEVRNELTLDDLFEELRYRTAQIQVTEGRRDELLDAVVTVARDLDLSAALRRIAEAAWSVVGCRYAALGVFGADGDLIDFIYAGEGVRTQEVDLSAEGRPAGGLALARLPDQTLLRLLERCRQAGTSGIADQADPAGQYLGVPVEVRGEVIGSLYLADKDGGAGFAPEDESLMAALAAVAGAAIANTRAYDNLQRRRAWQVAATEVTVALLTGAPGDALDAVAAGAQRVADAELVVVETVANHDQVTVAATGGPDTWELRGRVVRQANAPLFREVHATGRPLLIEDAGLDDRVRHSSALAGLSLGPVLVLPLAGREQLGALIVARKPAANPFGPLDVELAVAFANTVALALEFARLHHGRERRRAWQEASAEVATALVAADRSQALAMVAAGMQRVTGAEVVSVLVPAGANRVRVAGFAATGPPDMHGRILEPDETLLYRTVVDGGEVILVEDAAADPRCAYYGGSAGRPLGSAMMLPLVAQERVLGALFVGSVAGKAPFDDFDVELAASFTCNVALALEVSQLYEAMRRRQDWLTASATVTASLLDAKPEEALGLVARGVRQVAGAAMAAVEVPISSAALMLEAFDGEGDGDLPGRVVSLEDAPLYRQLRILVRRAPTAGDP